MKKILTYVSDICFVIVLNVINNYGSGMSPSSCVSCVHAQRHWLSDQDTAAVHVHGSEACRCADLIEAIRVALTRHRQPSAFATSKAFCASMVVLVALGRDMDGWEDEHVVKQVT